MPFKKIFPVLLVSAGALLAFTTARDVVSDVGTTIEEVKKSTVEQVYSGSFRMPWVNAKVRNACKALPAGAREATMMALGKVVHDYVNSPEFEKDYFAYIDQNARYKGPAPEDEKAAAERKRQEEYTYAQLKDPLSLDGAAMYCTAQANAAKIMIDLLKDNPDMPLPMPKSEYERTQKEATRLRALFDTDKESFKKQYTVFKVDQEIRSQLASQANDLKRQEQDVAQRRDYKKIIREELQQFLDATENINFKAATQQKGNKVVFTEQRYESMPNEWKFYFRCGPEAIGGARTYAKQWLKELSN